jgi:hypothetical protein
VANDLATRAEDLFTHFIAPLVLGGELVPGKILGARKALAIGVERSVTNIDLAAHVDLARIRIARKYVPIDRLAPLTAHEWSLAACLHDIVQSTHPSLSGIFRSDASRRILELVNLALDRIPFPQNAHDALSRHTIFSRTLEIGRADTRVSWWTGSSTFRGSEPPPRLLSWPELRRVHVDRTVHPLSDLPPTTKSFDASIFYDTLRRFLSMSPMTDLATANRTEIKFAWSESTLALVASPVGRTLAARAIRSGSLQQKTTTLDHATNDLQMKHPQAGAIARALVDELAFFNEAASHKNADGDLQESQTAER